MTGPTGAKPGRCSRAMSPMSGTRRCMQAMVAESLADAAASRFGPQIIWAKDRFALGRGDYHWQHEPAGTRSKRHGSLGGGSQANHAVADPDSHAGHADGHGTQKPVECMLRPIENNSSPGQAVYEPFSGSGTTIIAAEMTGRVCHAIELNPVYVDVAVRRWQAFTGQTAPSWRRMARSFAEVAEQRGVAWTTEPMAQRGRKPKPVAAKIAAGNPGKRPLTTLVPPPAPGDMLCPKRWSGTRGRWPTGRCTSRMRRRATCRRSTGRCWRGSAWRWLMPTRRMRRSRSWECW